MAILKLVKETYPTLDDVNNLYHYCFQTNKMPSGLCGFYGLNSQSVLFSIQKVKEAFHKESGPQVSHFIVSFHPKASITPTLAYLCAQQIAALYCDRYQVIFAVHEKMNASDYFLYNETIYIHIHFIVNTTSFVNGNSFRFDRNNFYQLKNYVEAL